MVQKEFTKKIAAVSITISLIALILLVLTPPTITAVYLHPGAPSYVAPLYNTAKTVTFNNVNLTIRESEAIPVNYLSFSIRKSSDNSEVAYVRFSIQGTETSDPFARFTVTPITDTSNLPYQESGGFGYDERTGWNTTFGSGYGPDTTDLTILYRITYITHITGTFYGQLYVNLTTHTYASGSSTTFTVSSPPSGGGDSEPSDNPTADVGGPYTGVAGTPIQFDGSKSTAGSGSTISLYSWSCGDGTTITGLKPTHSYSAVGSYLVTLTVTDNFGETDIASTTATIYSMPSTPRVTVTNQTLQAIAAAYSVSLPTQFYASDTNGDGTLDGFTDPNNQLTATGFALINGHASALLSTDNGDIPEFFWDTAANTMTPITHTPAPLTTPIINTTAKTVLIEITVDKTGWIYLELTDAYPFSEYPEYSLTIKAGERIISSDRIWRENGKIYILDDPATIYDLIYGYTILPPTFSPSSDTTVTTVRPTITITYPSPVYLVAAFLDTTDIIAKFMTIDNKVFIYTPTTDLTEGTHIINLVAQDDLAMHNLTSTATFTISLPQEPAAGIDMTWIIIIVIAIILIIVAVLFFLRDRGFI